MQKKTGFRVFCLAVLAPLLFSGCQGTAATPKKVSVIFDIDSTPQGALVTCSKHDGALYDEASILSLGETPMRRRRDIPPTGLDIRISKAGYAEWQGRITPQAPSIHAELRKLATITSAEAKPIVAVLPVRIALAGIKDANLPSVQQENTFRDTVKFSAKSAASGQFGDTTRFVDMHFANAIDVWANVEQSLRGVNVHKLMYYPEKPRLQLTPETEASLQGFQGRLLLLHVQAYYLDGGQRFTKAAVPILASVVSAGAAASAMATPGTATQNYTYYVYGPAPQQEIVIAQLFMIDPQKKELLWAGEEKVNGHYEDAKMVSRMIQKLFAQVPGTI